MQPLDQSQQTTDNLPDNEGSRELSEEERRTAEVAQISLENNTASASIELNTHAITETHTTSVDTLQKSSAAFSNSIAATPAVSEPTTSAKTFSQITLQHNDEQFESNLLREPDYLLTLTIDDKQITVQGAGKHKDGSLIATGAFGRVFFGNDPDTGKPIAIKVAIPKTDKDIPLLRKEGNFLLQMSKSEHVVGAHKVGFNNNIMFVLMDKIDGQELFDQLEETKKRRNFYQTVGILIDIAKGVKELHVQGIIHRDLKPENILVDKEGKAKLIDLGCAVTEEEKATTLGGTIEYLPPEILETSKPKEKVPPQTTKADIYTLGLVIHEVFTSHILENPRSSNGTINRTRLSTDLTVTENHYRHCSSHPSKLCSIVNSCLQLDPKKRPSIDEVIYNLENLYLL